MVAIKYLMLMIIGFGSGIVVSSAIFAFITILGLVPRLAQKTRTQKYIKLYEEAIIFGGIIGTLPFLFNLYLPIGNILVIIISLLIGIFYGCLAVSLAEVLNVMPILTRRGRLTKGLKYFILAIAFGKLFGSLVYYYMPKYFF